MTDYVTRRRLYIGAGRYIEKGDPAPDMTPSEREPLLASGAIGKARAKAAEKADARRESAKKAD